MNVDTLKEIILSVDVTDPESARNKLHLAFKKWVREEGYSDLELEIGRFEDQPFCVYLNFDDSKPTYNNLVKLIMSQPIVNHLEEIKVEQIAINSISKSFINVMYFDSYRADNLLKKMQIEEEFSKGFVKLTLEDGSEIYGTAKSKQRDRETEDVKYSFEQVTNFEEGKYLNEDDEEFNRSWIAFEEISSVQAIDRNAHSVQPINSNAHNEHPKLQDLELQHLSFWGKKINEAEDLYDLDILTETVKFLENPYIKHVLGFRYYILGNKDTARKYLNECVTLSLNNYDRIQDNFLIDSLGSALYVLTLIEKDKLAEKEDVWLKYFVTSYVSLSKAISFLPAVFDTYRNRALLLLENIRIAPQIVVPHLGMGAVTEGLIFSDFYSSFQDAMRVGANVQAKKSASDVEQMLLEDGNLSIEGKELQDWNSKDLNVILKQRHSSLFKGLSVDYYKKYHLKVNDLIS